jgi:hypothetical protein
MTARAVNDVQVDAAAELAAIESAGDAHADELAQQQTEAAGHDPDAWLEGATWVTQFLSGKVCPNWALAADDEAELAKRLARVLDHYLPGAVQGMDQWHPLLQLGGALAMVTAARGVDWHAMQLKPLHEPKRKDATTNGDGETSGRDASVLDGAESIGQDRKRFTMGGG